MKTPITPKKQKANPATKDGLMKTFARQVGHAAGTIMKAAQGLTGQESSESPHRPTDTSALETRAPASHKAAKKKSVPKNAAAFGTGRGRKRSSAGASTKDGAKAKTKARSS